MRRALRIAAGLAAPLLLAACGGSVSGSGDEVPQSGDSPARDPSFVVGSSSAALSFVGYEGDGTLLEGEDESVVRLATGEVTGGRFEGTLNAARTRIDLAGGGEVVLTDPSATEYVRVFARTARDEDPVFGVVGFLSSPGDLPGSGRLSYTGTAEVVAADGTRRYVLDGEAAILADFGADRVRIELGGLGGTAQGLSPGNTGAVSVPRGGLIAIDDSRISGATFSGGTASVSGLPFSVTGDADASGTRGAFFGPDADEAAGRVVVNDPQGDVEILGIFTAE